MLMIITKYQFSLNNRKYDEAEIIIISFLLNGITIKSFKIK